jgi:hypothetical protein
LSGSSRKWKIEEEMPSKKRERKKERKIENGRIWGGKENKKRKIKNKNKNKRERKTERNLQCRRCDEAHCWSWVIGRKKG